jgi:hypothetical protein
MTPAKFADVAGLSFALIGQSSLLIMSWGILGFGMPQQIELHCIKFSFWKDQRDW